MQEIKKNNFSLLFFIISLIHIFISLQLTNKYSTDFDLEQKYIFIISKSLSSIIIIYLWQLFYRYIYNIKIKNQKTIEYTKYFFTYFILNLILLIILYPAPQGFPDISILYRDISNYKFEWIVHLTTNIDAILCYNIIPSFFGIIVCNIFLYSLIFSYCLYNTKLLISEKYYKLLYIPFCIPAVLIFNQIQRRSIMGAWLLLFMFLYLIFNKDKNCNCIKQTIALGILTGFLTNFRAEFFPLLIIFPLSVYLLKIFSLKRYFLYLLIFIITHFSIITVQNNFLSSLEYKLENYQFIYLSLDKERKNNLNPKYKNTIRTVYPNFETNDDFSIINPNASKKQLNDVIRTYEKILIKNSFYLLKRNYLKHIDNISNKNDFMELKFSLAEKYFNRNENTIFTKKINHIELKEKLLSMLIYFNPDYNTSKLMKYIYSLAFNFLILILMIILGAYYKKMIYVIYALTWLMMIFCVITISMIGPFIYYYIFWFNTLVMFFVFILDCFNKKNCDMIKK